VPPAIKELWDALDEDQKAAYGRLGNVWNNFAMMIGEAGTGKTKLIEFIMVNAMHGDKNRPKPMKGLILQPQNTGVNDTAQSLHAIKHKYGLDFSVIRLHSYETEVQDWMAKSGAAPRRERPLTRRSDELPRYGRTTPQ
jgi:hypothetical protein